MFFQFNRGHAQLLDFVRDFDADNRCGSDSAHRHARGFVDTQAHGSSPIPEIPTPKVLPNLAPEAGLADAKHPASPLGWLVT